MEKNEAFRKQVLSRLYGLPDPTESGKDEPDDADADADSKSIETKEVGKDKVKEEEKPIKDEDTTQDMPERPESESTQTKSEKEDPPKTVDVVKHEDVAAAAAEKMKEVSKEEKEDSSPEKGTLMKDKKSEKENKEDVKSDHSNNNGDSVVVAAKTTDSKTNSPNNSSRGTTTPTTTTSHLYSVLMAPLDGRSPYRDHAQRSAPDQDSPDQGPRKRLRVDNSTPDKSKSDHKDSKITSNANSSVGMDLSKNQKKKLKKKRRKHLLNRLEVQRAKDFIYSSENEQFSVEKLRTMIEDVTEFLDAIWDVYCSEARLKGESVEEEGYRAAAVLKCLSASGEGRWGDLQLLSRAKSVLVLRNKSLAASTISQVESELGYDADVRNFIVRMLKFWMDEIVTKG